MSNKCDETKLKQIAGDALIKIVKTSEDETMTVYNITLELDKMDFSVLTKKMLDAGCF